MSAPAQINPLLVFVLTNCTSITSFPSNNEFPLAEGLKHIPLLQITY